MSEVNEISTLSIKLEEVSKKIEANVATKSEVDSLQANVKALESRLQESADKGEKLPVFGSKFIADKAVSTFVAVAMQHPQFKMASRDNVATYKTSALALTSAAANSGHYGLPTELDPIISELVYASGFAQKYARVIPVAGTRAFNITTDDTVTYAVADDASATATESTPAFTQTTLTTTQIVTLSKISEKLFRESPLAITTMLVQNMARSQARYIDAAWLKSIKDNTSVPVTTLAALTNLTWDSLVDMRYAAHESIDASADCYLASRNAIPVLRKLKAGNGSSFGSDEYRIQLNGPMPNIDGVPLVICPRMDSGSAAGDMVIAYGNFGLGTVLGVGRERELGVSTELDFLKVGLAYRMVSDYGVTVLQPTAMSKVRITATT